MRCAASAVASSLLNLPVEELQEAHYFCAVINTAMASLISTSYSTSKSFGTPSVLEHIAIPSYEASNSLHRSLAALSQRAHKAAVEGEQAQDELRKVEEEIDELAARLWGITKEELTNIHRALADLV